MNTVLKFERVILTKELNEKFKKVGEAYEIAIVREGSFLLREASTKAAIGVVSFDDFEKCFVKEDEFNGWTEWTPLVGMYGETDVFYKTNRKRVKVKFMMSNITAEASCSPTNDFNLFFGIKMAYYRCHNKLLLKKKLEYENKLKEINKEISDNSSYVNNMINSLSI